MSVVSITINRILTGQNKMVINHLEKLFVTNDAATILRELEVSFRASEVRLTKPGSCVSARTRHKVAD